MRATNPLRVIFATLLLSLSLTAQAKTEAECKADITAHFENFKAMSLVIVHPAGREYMAQAVLKFDDDLEPAPGSYMAKGKFNINGNASFLGSIVRISPKVLCADDEETWALVVAHELGHLLSYVMRDDIKAKSKYSTEWQLEAWANEYGAKLFRQAQRSSEPYLAIADKKCAAGSQYFCDRAESWRYGLTY